MRSRHRKHWNVSDCSGYMKVQLFATLREGRGKETEIPWYDGIDGHTVLKELCLETGDVKIFLINGRHSDPDTAIKPDDIIALFPAVGGG